MIPVGQPIKISWVHFYPQTCNCSQGRQWHMRLVSPPLQVSQRKGRICFWFLGYCFLSQSKAIRQKDLGQNACFVTHPIPPPQQIKVSELRRRRHIGKENLETGVLSWRGEAALGGSRDCAIRGLMRSLITLKDGIREGWQGDCTS